MTRHLLVPATLLLGLAAARPAAAWNGTGHQVIAVIAWDHLTPAAKAKVGELLRAHPDYDSLLAKAGTPADGRERQAFLLNATWPDLVRTPNTPRSRYNHPGWHFVDYPYVVGEWPATQPAASQPDTAWKPGADPANAAQAFVKCLADVKADALPAADRAVALAWVEHLVGDIHQPLHAVSLFSADLPRGDQGGNQLIVAAGGGVSTLHALWDGLLGSYEANDLIERVARTAAERHPPAALADAAKDLRFEAWAKESFELSKTAVYLEGKLPYLRRDLQAADRLRPVPAVPAGYLEAGKATAEERAVLAGLRLAAVLNAAL